MVERSQSGNNRVFVAQDTFLSADTARHPAWCDPNLCTANPASQANRYRPGVGGEHRSAPIPLDFTTAFMLPSHEATAWLSEACAPWRCAVHLRVQIGDVEFSMSAHHASQALEDLTTLLASAATREEVTP
jgi:hypothetical protein